MTLFGLVLGLMFFGGYYVSCAPYNGFVKTCTNIQVKPTDDSYLLCANCSTSTYLEVATQLDLGEYLVNDNGVFRAEREGHFGPSAANVSLVTGEDSCMLLAILKTDESDYVWAAFPLNDYIGNIDGTLTW